MMDSFLPERPTPTLLGPVRTGRSHRLSARRPDLWFSRGTIAGEFAIAESAGRVCVTREFTVRHTLAG